MTRVAILVAGLAGLAVIARAIAFYAGVDAVALAVCVGMAVVLVLGMIELARVAKETDALRAELAALPSDADVTLLDRVSPELRSLLHARLERVALPLPTAVFTPYFVGLLVMLGLLGTFLGLFETLRGTHVVLGGSGDVDALRQGLIQPMQGLMRSFGTSAAGVTGSAMLGLASVFGRRATAELSRQVHVIVAGALASASPAERQLAAITTLAEQGRSLPDAAKALATATSELTALRAELVRSIEATTRSGADALTAASKAQADAIAGATTAQTDAIASAAKAQAEALAAAAKTQADALSAATRSQAEAMTRTAQEITASITATAKQTSDAQTTASATSQKALLDGAQRVERALTAAIEKIEAAQAESIARADTRRDEADARAEARQREALEQSAHRIETSIVTTLAKAGEAAVLAGERSVEAAREAVSAFTRDAATTQASLLEAVAQKQAEASSEALAVHATSLVDTVRARFDALRADEAQRSEALVASLAAVAQTVANETSSAVRAQTEAAEKLRGLADESARVIAAFETAAEAREAASASRLGELVKTLEQELAAASQTFVTAMSETTSSTRETEARAAASFATLAKTADEVAASARAQAEAIAQLASVSSSGLEDAEKRAEARLEALTTALGGKLGETSDVVREAAASVQAASIELGATAEAFVSAVERNQRAAEEWLANLGRVEAAVAEAGEEAASDTLAQHLAHMHDVFERQLRFQQEVFDQLRALRGARAVEPVTESADGPS